MTRSRRRGFEAVTFDLFGTLVHVDEDRLPRLDVDGVSVPSLLAAPLGRLRERVPAVNLGEVLVAYLQALAEIRARRGVDAEREDPPWTLLATCLDRVGIVDDTLARDLARSQMEATLRAARPAKDARSVLDHLRGRGYSLGLVSNLADASGGYELLSRLNLKTCFDATVFSGEVGWRKPDRRIFEAALSALHVEGRAVLHVGDELRADVWGAGRCGLRTVWLNENGRTLEDEYPPLLEIQDLAALMDAELAP